MLSQLRPMVPVVMWVLCSAATQILNKKLYLSYSFDYPLILTLIHMSVSFLCCLLVLVVTRMHPLSALTWSEYLSGALPLAFVFIINIIFGNFSLLHIHVSLYQVLKASTPLFAVALQSILFSSHQSVPVLLSLIPIVAGVIIATNFEAHYDAVGVCLGIAASATTALQTILSSRLMKKTLDPVNLLFYMAPAGGFFLLPFIFFFSDESQRIARASTSIESPWELYFVLIASGVIAFLLNFSLFYAIQSVGALSFVIIGNVKVVFVIFFSAYIIGNVITPLNALGCFIAVAGAALYQYLQLRDKLALQKADATKKVT